MLLLHCTNWCLSVHLCSRRAARLSVYLYNCLFPCFSVCLYLIVHTSSVYLFMYASIFFYLHLPTHTFIYRFTYVCTYLNSNREKSPPIRKVFCHNSISIYNCLNTKMTRKKNDRKKCYFPFHLRPLRSALFDYQKLRTRKVYLLIIHQ